MTETKSNEDRKVEALEEIAKSLSNIDGHLFQIHALLTLARSDNPLRG
ncbi:hypothetical protein [Alteraurantiacibacter aquimixticola]|nr:hypothetical protein [Alteraurantiacibacter aquimixticola]